ncbi:hypothetical protein E4T42_09184 [Aureobasidium subglaciale]|nr:hypothetical protein E4T42_09184 [Aureobasidium subglaciale]
MKHTTSAVAVQSHMTFTKMKNSGRAGNRCFVVVFFWLLFDFLLPLASLHGVVIKPPLYAHRSEDLSTGFGGLLPLRLVGLCFVACYRAAYVGSEGFSADTS